MGGEVTQHTHHTHSFVARRPGTLEVLHKWQMDFKLGTQQTFLVQRGVEKQEL